MNISIIFPVYNEEKNLEKLISDWSIELIKNNINHEFVIAEDGSKDNTKNLIKELERKYPIVNLSQLERRGYSKAVYDGIFAASKQYILCTDSDNQIKVESLVENLKNFPKNNEFLMGYRNPRKDPLNRLIYSKLFKIYHDILFNSGLRDPSCPFVIGLKETYEKLDKKKLMQMKEGFWWGFVGTCKAQKIKIYEVPIKHYSRNIGEAGYKLKNLLGIILRNFIGLLKIKFN